MFKFFLFFFAALVAACSAKAYAPVVSTYAAPAVTYSAYGAVPAYSAYGAYPYHAAAYSAPVAYTAGAYPYSAVKYY